MTGLFLFVLSVRRAQPFDLAQGPEPVEGGEGRRETKAKLNALISKSMPTG